MSEFETGVFAPHDIACLQKALDRSVKALAFAFPEDSQSFECRRIRRVLAQRILALAQHGERDPQALSNGALAFLPPYHATDTNRSQAS